MSSAGWDHFDADADVGVRGWGPTRGEAFAQATLGVFALLVGPDEVLAREQREIRAQADGPQALLAAWIDECLYVQEIEGFVARSIDVSRCTDTLAHGVLHGEPLDPIRHRVGTGVRRITAHQVAVDDQSGRHEVRIVVDI